MGKMGTLFPPSHRVLSALSACIPGTWHSLKMFNRAYSCLGGEDRRLLLEEELGKSARTGPGVELNLCSQALPFCPLSQWLGVCGGVGGAARTVESAPATDVAGCLVGQDFTGRREAGELD